MTTSTTILPGTVKSPFQGFDCETVLTSAQAQIFKQAGYSFCIRYLSLTTPQAPGDLSNAEAVAILNAGLALMAVQHVRAEGWGPSGTMGTQDGNNAVANAQSIGLPPGINIWCDLEGIDSIVSADSISKYCTDWYNSVAQAGYVPGLYVGANAMLDGQQLYGLPFQHYWKSMSDVPAIPTRGYQMMQLPTMMGPCGFQIDPDVVLVDQCGGTVKWLLAQ